MRWLACALFTFFCLLIHPVTATAEEGARVILVLDASGSMWGQIGGKPKMQIAKEVVGKVIANWKEADEIGLVAYGHRQKGSCDDIQVLIEPGKLDKDAYMKAVKGLNAKGKTPMTAAVRMAAESLKFTEKKATVILVSDGIETCDVDPCAVASELEKLGVGLTVHTVGFNVDDPAAKDQLKCLAENTGGIATTAENADELEAKINETITVTETKPEEPPPPPAVPEFNVTGHVTLAEGVELSEPWLSPTWEFHKVAADGSRGEWVKTEYGHTIKTKLDPMDYIVTVTDDVAKVSFPQTIGADVVLLEPSLEAGGVNFSGMQDATTPIDSDGTAWELLSPTGEWITTKYGPKAGFLLNAGAYKIRLALGSAKVEQDFKVVAGKFENIVVTLGGGFVVATAQYGANGPAVDSNLTIEVRKAEQNADGDYQWIDTKYEVESRFSLPAGKYRIVAIRDYAKASVETDVKAGQETKLKITLDAGLLAIKGPAGTTAIEVRDAKPNIEGQKKWIATEYTADLNKAFNSGAYEVTAKGEGDTVLGTKTFDVKAGERTEGAIP
jgi:Ca-activated chloride channel homolog